MRLGWLSFFILSFGVGFYQTSFAQNSCTVRDLTNNCQMFSEISPNDIIQTADGRKVPACMFTSVYSNVDQSYIDRAERGAAELRQIVTAALERQGLALSEEVETEFYRRLPEALMETGSSSYTLEWPPTGGGEERRVSRDELIDYVTGIIDRAELFSLLQAAAEANSRFGYSEREAEGFGQEVNLGPFNDRRARLFIQAQTEARNFVLAGRSPSGLPAAERAIYDRIDLISRVRGFEDADRDGLSNCGPANLGAYDITTHQVMGFANSQAAMPDASIVRGMAHEIAHSFDYCQTESSLHRLEGDALDHSYRMRIRDFETEEVYPGPHYGFPVGATGETLPAETIVSNQVPSNESPFADVYACLRTADGGGFVPPGTAPGTPLSPENACRNNYHNEAFCDWFAAQILGRMARSSGGSGQFGKTVTDNGNGTRTHSFSAGSEYVLMQLDLACSDIVRGESGDTGTHPSWERRLNDIILRQPDIARAVGCRPQGANQPCPPPSFGANTEVLPPSNSSPVED